MYVFLFCTLSQRVENPALKWACGEPKNTLSSAPSAKRGGKRHIRGCLRGGPTVARLRAPPLSAWLIRKTSEVASGRGRVVPSVSALYLADSQEVGAQGWLALA